MIAHKMPGLDEAVTAALADAEPLLRLTATEGLAAIAHTSTFLELLPKALTDSDVEVRWVAVKTLASSPAALEKMPEQARRYAVDLDPLLRQALLAHLSTAPTVRTVVAELLTQGLLDSDATTCISAANRASATLFAVGGPASAPQAAVLASLVARLAEQDATRAGAAGCALSLIMNPTVEAAVREALASPSLLQPARATDLLRKKKLVFDPAVLTDVIRHGSEAERLYVCGTLARVQSAACVPLALAALESPYPAVRQSAVYALEVITDSSALAALIGALQHHDANVRYRAAIVLGRRPESAPAVEALRKTAANDSEAKVRGAAKIAAVCVSGGDVTSVLFDPVVLRDEAKQLAGVRFANPTGRPTLVENGVALVGSQKQLFVDDLVIADLGGAERQLHRFRKDARNPVLEQQFPWELMGPVSYCTTVRYDPETKLFSFWYTSFGRISQAGEAIASRAQCLALSTDGIEWKRPRLGQHPFGSSPDSNLVGRAPNIVFNPAEQDAARRFASYAYVPDRNGMAVSFSPDSISSWIDWKFVCGGGNDVVTACRDDLNPGTFSFMKWRIVRWFRRAAWPVWEGDARDDQTRPDQRDRHLRR
jgi:HEAT repeat protein